MMRNEAHASRLVDYDGWPLGSMTPSDIDAVIEFKGECFIFIDYKYGDGELSKGQQIMYERLVDGMTKPAILFIASHDVEVPAPIKAKDCVVRLYYYNGSWIDSTLNPHLPLRLYKAIDAFLKQKAGKKWKKNGKS